MSLKRFYTRDKRGKKTVETRIEKNTDNKLKLQKWQTKKIQLQRNEKILKLHVEKRPLICLKTHASTILSLYPYRINHTIRINFNKNCMNTMFKIDLSKKSMFFFILI